MSSSRVVPAVGTASFTSSDASVSVPVLSRQSTSTAASDSTAFSCWASAPRLAIRIAATAKVTLVSRISPSGTIVTTAATEVVTASWNGTCRLKRAYTSVMPSGTISATRMNSSRSITRSSGERGWRNSRASPARRAA